MNPIKRRPNTNGRRTPRRTNRTTKQKRSPRASATHTKPRTTGVFKRVAPVTTPPAPQPTPRAGVRINKYLADKGIAARREVDVLIANRQVLVNGQAATIGQRVLPGDSVEVLGATKDKRYYAYYKGRGVITHSPAVGEIDIAARLKKDYGLTDITPVGRLDKDSEGLIILSNDGRITEPLLSPDANHPKEYHVIVDKPITMAFLKLLEIGVDIEGYQTKPATATALPRNERRFSLIIGEGKKHQIRRMCAALGYQVENLKRVRIMNITLGDLKPNQYRKISGPELRAFLQDLGIT